MLAYPRNLKAVTKTNRKNKRPLFSLSNLRNRFFRFWNCNVYWWFPQSMTCSLTINNVPFFLYGPTSATMYPIVLVPVFRLLHGLGRHGTVKRLREPWRHNASDNAGEQGWRSGESTRLPPMWPGFDSRTRRHMWVEFVVGFLLCSERFFSGYTGFPLSAKTNISKLQFDPECSSVIIYCGSLRKWI